MSPYIYILIGLFCNVASFPACCRRSCKKRIESRRGGIKRSLIANRNEKEVGKGGWRERGADTTEMGHRRRLLLEKLASGMRNVIVDISNLI